MMQKSFKQWALVGAVSVLLHVTGLAFVGARDQTRRPPTKVKINLVEVKKEKEEIIEAVPPTPPPTPPPKPKPTPRPKPKPKPTAPPAATQVKPKEPLKEQAAPVQGFDKKNLLPADGKSQGISVPVGNTLMVEDQGIRKDDVKPFEGDLSRDARLVRSSVTVPQYTDAAIDANVEGAYIVDVYVDERGMVVDVDLRKKIGYGMDDRVLSAARGARFEPRLNRLGRPLPGWTEIKFDLRIP